MKIVIATGGFDPIHSGHIKYLEAAKKLGDILIVGLNSDAWLERKKGRAFMPWQERAAVLRALAVVDRVDEFDDLDGSARSLLLKAKQDFQYARIVFANGGDRTSANIPEMDVDDIEFAFGVGGEDKANSSSWILEEWKAPKTKRPWGYYRVLHEVPGTKVKELTVNPGKSLSMQRHSERSEYWLVTHGQAQVDTVCSSGQERHTHLELHDEMSIDEGSWHRLSNPYSEPCRIVEIQYGHRCEEDDIERR